MKNVELADLIQEYKDRQDHDAKIISALATELLETRRLIQETIDTLKQRHHR